MGTLIDTSSALSVGLPLVVILTGAVLGNLLEGCSERTLLGSNVPF